MFIKVKYYGHQVLVNPCCPIRVIYEYLRVKLEIDEEKELDLCDEFGHLKLIHSLPPSKNGLEVFTRRAQYVIILFDRSQDGSLINPIPLLDKGSKTYLDIMRALGRPKGKAAHKMAHLSAISIKTIKKEQ